MKVAATNERKAVFRPVHLHIQIETVEELSSLLRYFGNQSDQDTRDVIKKDGIATIPIYPLSVAGIYGQLLEVAQRQVPEFPTLNAFNLLTELHKKFGK